MGVTVRGWLQWLGGGCSGEVVLTVVKLWLQ